MRLPRIGVVTGLLVVAAACGGQDVASNTTIAPIAQGSAGTTDIVATATTGPHPVGTEVTLPASTDSAPKFATTTPRTTAPPTTAPATTAPPITTSPAPTATTAEPRALVDLKVYFLRGEQLAIAHRQVPGPAVLRGALIELLTGPTADEVGAGLVTAIPGDTTLLDVDLADELTTVDLSDDYEVGGGTLSMTARVAQIVFTATQFDNSDAVLFWIDGEPVDFLGGEGIVLDEPQARTSVDRAFTGGVIVDTPAPGSTVTSPFTVTGEGDVYEADFPIEIWRDGERVGGVLGFAGAWGEWADFEATITLDIAPGPIELVAYDVSGCTPGDPECSPPVKSFVPLVLAG